MNKNKNIFEDLFVLELANNHWGCLDRGIKIIDAYAEIIKKQGINAAIKLQFRDVEHFIHPDFLNRQDLRYVSKTQKTALGFKDFKILINHIKSHGIIPMATPFDEESVRWCDLLDLPIIKISSADLNDWPLLLAIAELERPVICSTGGGTFEKIDLMVSFFEARNIPLAINHCVALYPTEDQDLNLNQIDLLKCRYSKHTIGFSTHEYHDWESSVLMAYAKGARTFERHVDIDLGDYPVSPYCSLPDQIDRWFQAFKKAKLMCGEFGEGVGERKISEQEKNYLNHLLRGVYAKRDLPDNYFLDFGDLKKLFEDVYLAIPLQAGQLSCQDIDLGKKAGIVLNQQVLKDQGVFNPAIVAIKI